MVLYAVIWLVFLIEEAQVFYKPTRKEPNPGLEQEQRERQRRRWQEQGPETRLELEEWRRTNNQAAIANGNVRLLNVTHMV